MAAEFNESQNGRGYTKQEKQSFHQLMEAVVRECLPIGKNRLLLTFRELRDLRVQADYYPTNIEPSDLETSLLGDAKELFNLFERKLVTG